MLSTYNTAILFIVSIIIAYTYVAGVADAAHKGEVENQRHHALWTPVRQAGCLAALAPFPGLGGISVCQVAFTYMIMASVGATDTMWTSAVDWMASNGGQVTPISSTGAADFNSDDVSQLLQTAVTTYYLQSQGFSGGSFACKSDGSSTTMCSVSGLTNSGDTVPFGAVGGISLSCGVGASTTSSSSSGSSSTDNIGTYGQSEGQDICTGRANGVMAAWNAITPVAQAILSWQGASSSGTSVSGMEGDVATAITDYDQAVSSAYSTALSQQQPAQAAALNDFKTTASSEGWAAAGMYYYEMGRLNQVAQAAMEGDVTPLPANGSAINPLVNSDYTGFTAAADAFMSAAEIGGAINTSAATTAASGVSSTGADGQIPGFAEQAMQRINSLFPVSNLMTYVVNQTAGGDPIVSLQTTGNEMLDIAEAGLFAYDGARVADSAVDAQKNTPEGWLISAIPGVGNVAVGSLASAKTILTLLSPIVWMVALALLIAGITLAYYLPLAPAVLFGLEVISWLILVLEGFIAVPLWLAAHSLPTGGGITGDAGKQGYMFLLGILLRPILLVFALFCSLGTMNAASYLFVNSLNVAFQSEWQGKFFGLVTMLVGILILTGATYAMTNRIVGIITWLPTAAVGWIGARGAEMGSERQENVIAGNIGRGAGEVKQGANQVMQTELRKLNPPPNLPGGDDSERKAML
jgi:conjugal transfer/type IV secretion protein DotA/TraY